MNIIFWLEFPLFHVAALIKSLSLRENVKVIVVTEYDIPKWRLDMGFPRPDFGSAIEFYSPDKTQRSKIVEQYKSHNDYHIFHGLRHVKENYRCFKRLTKKSAYLGLYFEPQQYYGGLKAIFRRVYYRALLLKYRHRVDFMLSLGELGAKQYIALGLPPEKVFSFEYHTDKSVGEIFSKKETNGNLTFLYAGRLVKRKNISLALEAFYLISKKGFSDFEFLVIGNGAEEEILKSLVKKYKIDGNIRFLDSLPSNELNNYYINSDAFILPSKFEGWGAVATEAMALGLPLIISDGCASSCIVKEEYQGYIFENDSIKSLENKLSLFIQNREWLTNDFNRNKRINYAKRYLSGEAGSNKLLGILKKVSN